MVTPSPASFAPIVRAPATLADEVHALIRLAAPLAGANLLQMAVYAVDVIFVARLAPVEFAASTLGVFLYGIALWALLGLATACAPIIAAELGQRAHAVREVRRSFRMALWLSLFASIPCLIVLAHGETVFRLAGQDAVVAQRAGAFLDILLFALVPSVAAGVMRTVAAALGRPNWALAVTVMALMVGIAANWALVFGNAGFPALGLEGSALASLVTTLAMTTAFAAILVFDPRLRRYRLFGRWWRPEWPRLIEILQLGLPIALAFTLEGSLFGGAAVLMGLISVTAVAAHAVALNIAAITFQIPLGIAQAATIRVGMAYGARDPVWIDRAGRAAIVAAISFMAMTACAIWFFPRLWVSAYLDLDAPANAQTVPLAVSYLAIAAMFQLLDGAQVVLAGTLRGLQDTRAPMFIAGFGYWVVGFGTAIGLGFWLGMAGVGIWLGLAAGLLAVSILLLWRWMQRARLGLLPT
ncbi:MAG: MATE family efflux transporter [Sphingomonas sp.]|jgi:MATE family, multidrug efflux pump|uniref:MATE family efflux transporter n=1 Tax=Sphingomonas sp. TaxID=28214 RepID=UPI000DB1839F|nr:MATE family efflux transporter [Sphingomonas sp.]PZP19744.1 MAG: MATE family efflux transporter [Sphingomonas hengshuiensis]